jgi:hypothetical protein
MMKRALAYRVGSFILATFFATLILQGLRPTALTALTISLITSAFLQVTHTIYYIIFHRLWREPDTKCRQREYAAFKRGYERGVGMY